MCFILSIHNSFLLIQIDWILLQSSKLFLTFYTVFTRIHKNWIEYHASIDDIVDSGVTN